MPDPASPPAPAPLVGNGPHDARVAPLDAVVVAAARKDFWQLRACVASVRHWYADLPVLLLKDEAQGPFDTAELCRAFDVAPFPASRRSFGSPLAKLDVLFRPERKRYLVLDADTAVVGPVVELLERYAADFVVAADPVGRGEAVGAYYDHDRLAEFDPTFEPPGWAFNSGQLVVTGGVLTPADFATVVAWEEDRPRNLRGDVFPLNDQPRLNYVLQRESAAGRVSVDGCPFKLNPSVQPIPVGPAELAARSDRCPPAVVHWMGRPEVTAGGLPHGEVFRFYEEEYFRRVGRPGARAPLAAGRAVRRAVMRPVPKPARRAVGSAVRAVAGAVRRRPAG